MKAFRNWRARLRARNLYIELSDRIPKKPLEEKGLLLALNELESLYKGTHQEAEAILRRGESLLKQYPRRAVQIVKEAIKLLLCAFFILVLNRQIVFEHQQIPTGSMRPTFYEKDRVFISKTAFGINNPFGFRPWSQEKNLVQRGQIVTFTSEGLAGEEGFSGFRLFSNKKRLVKRLLAKGSDCLYFYGGHIWILDAENQLHLSKSFLEKPHEYIPFHRFFGRLEKNSEGKMSSRHFNKTIFELEPGRWNLWKNRDPEKPSHPWGLHHFAMTRLLTHQQAQLSPLPLPEEGSYYLDIAHHPVITPTAMSFRDASSPFYCHRTLLPLSKEHFQTLRSHLYTCRFHVKEERAYRYDFEAPLGKGLPLPNIANGLYEFQDGIAYSVASTGNRKALEKSHPLYKESLVPTFFNSGIDWAPQSQFKETVTALMPFRYLYYDRGDLKCLAHTLMGKEDATLAAFVEKEKSLEKSSGGLYPPFVDEGAPTVESIQKEGMRLAPEEILLLGDNHAGSGDSRDFGLATYQHLEGSPLWRFWPLSSLTEGIDSPYRGINLYDALVWGFLLLLALFFEKWRRWRFLSAKNAWQL